jgi:hypothetical protein
LIPTTPIPGSSFVIYDGRVQAGAAATIPSPLFSAPSFTESTEPIRALGEVKTQHEFLLRVHNGTASSTDLYKLDRLVTQILKEASIAKICKEDYFLSFDNRFVAFAGAVEINKRLPEDLKVRVRYVQPPYDYYNYTD